MRLKKTILVLAGALMAATTAHAGVFVDRGTFEASLGTMVVDDYENGAYVFVQSDADMSSVLGETQYTSTGHVNNNIVWDSAGNHLYCAGCNGSFLLDFSSTSVSTGSGVFGVGFEYFNNGDQYTAFVTYGDGSQANIGIPGGTGASDMVFIGLTSDLLISSIHLGLLDGGTSVGGSFALDNLTIGSRGDAPVPAPAALGFLGLGLAGLGLTKGRRKA